MIRLTRETRLYIFSIQFESLPEVLEMSKNR